MVGSGVAILTVADGDFVNDGTFMPGTSDFHMVNNSGNDLSISGTGSTSFDWLYVEMGGQDLILEKDIDAARVIFDSGHFDLNGNNVNLAGIIENEDETRSFIGPNGGEIIHVTNLSSPASANPGNLGAEISSTADLGEVTVRRSHQPDMSGGAESIARRYTSTPANNAGLDATLRFRYLENELNGLSESGLELWRNEGPGWDLMGTSSRDGNENWLELTGINAFSEWTAAEGNFSPVMDLPGGQSLRVGALFPNPVAAGSGQVRIPFSTPLGMDIQVRIFDNLGREVKHMEQYFAAGKNILSLDMDGIGSGIYHVQFGADGQAANLKLVVD